MIITTNLLLLFINPILSDNCVIDYASKNFNTERQLKNDLLCNYNRSLPPQKLTTVTAHYVPFYFSFESSEQVFTVYATLILHWLDTRLAWKSEDYDGISEIKIDRLKLWTPRLTRDHRLVYEDMYRNLVAPCTVLRFGYVFCSPRVVSKTVCTPDFSKWPYDTKYCSIKFGLNTNYTNRVILKASNDFSLLRKDLHNFENGPGWNVISFNRTDNANQFVTSIILKRKGANIQAITVIPTLTLSVLTFSSLCVGDNGIRGGIAFLSLLGHLYIMSYISENIPKYGSGVPSILRFITTSLVFTSLVIILNFVLSFILRKKDPPKLWIVTMNEFVNKSFIRCLIWSRWDLAKLESVPKDTKVAVEFLKLANIINSYLLLTAICLVAVASGIQLTFPSVLNPAIIGSNNTVNATTEQASWITVSLGLGGLVSYTFLPVIFEIYGRKMAVLITNVFMICGSLIFCVANDVYSMALARFVQGLAYGGSFTSVITLSECVPPKRRGYFMVVNKVSVGLGSLVCHALGIVLNWRQIAVSGALPNCLSTILILIVGESPSYYANRAEFEKCEAAFKWYRGDSLNARREIKELVTAQRENFRLKSDKNGNFFKKTKNMLLSEEFRKSFYIVSLATLCIDTCGRIFIFAYITQILLEITKNKSLAMYISVVSDAIFMVALGISSVLVKHFNRRTLLFNLGYFSAFLMFMVSLTIILKDNIPLLQDIKWLIPSVIVFHTFITNIGLVPAAFALTGEVYSLDQRALGSITSGFVFLVFFNIVLKITPAMIDSTGVEGTYSIYGTCLLIFLLLLQNVLPETKDKTLQAIEDELKGIVRKNSEVELLEVNPNK